MRRLASFVAVAALVGACVSPTTSPSAGAPTAEPSNPATASRSQTGGDAADTVFRGGNVITMDDALPRAEAIAIRGEMIAAIGANADVEPLIGPATRVVDLEGRTVVPGFIDTHQHRIGNRANIGVEDPRELIGAAIEQGWTTLHELYVDEGRLAELRDLDLAGDLPVRVNAYLPVNENSPEGRMLGQYYESWQPGEFVSPHVRIGGLKVFTDFDNAQILLWSQDDLDSFLLDAHRSGWQLGIKTVSTTSLDMILGSVRSIREVDPAIVDGRVRLEHALFATPEQIEAIRELGIIPIIQANIPGQLIGDPAIDELVAREPAGSYAPWRSMLEAGVLAAGATGFPSYYVDEPTGAPFASPMRLVYQGVTRTGNLGATPDPALLDEAMTAEQTLRLYTISAAYSAFEDDLKGSLAVGKLADLVVLSADPLAIPPLDILEIDVMLTMIGGAVEHCAAGAESICPDGRPSASGEPPTEPSPGASKPAIRVTASAELAGQPASNAVDGSIDTAWISGADPEQWIQLDLGEPRAFASITLTVAQDPAGPTTHEIWIGPTENDLRRIHVFSEETADGMILTAMLPAPEPGVRFVRVVTTAGPSWVAWREIEIGATD